MQAGVPLEHITMTSDGCGSLPDFDKDGNIIKLVSGDPASILRETIDAVYEKKIPLEQALLTVTSNPARILKLSRKGRIAIGMDADLVLLDPEYRVYHLIANGKFLVKNGKQAVDGCLGINGR